jgi:hypothetical protein
MDKFIGKSAVINKPSAMTHEMPCVVEKWDKEAEKYFVDFGKGWCGWYLPSELVVEAVMSDNVKTMNAIEQLQIAQARIAELEKVLRQIHRDECFWMEDVEKVLGYTKEVGNE